MRHSGRFFFVAADAGPREALAPIAAYCGRPLIDVALDFATTREHWVHQFATGRDWMLVTGTSDSARGQRVESAARRAARLAAIPIVAIEDFPGNYSDVEDGAASLVIVESHAARDLCAARFGKAAPAISVFSPARYDPYRLRLDALRRRTLDAWRSASAPRALWAGQPETRECIATLEALLPCLRAEGVELLFKAHPRDPGYREGAYLQVLDASGVPCRDVTASSVEDALSLGPRLVVTQFSSMAIEAGFHSIPSLWILLPGAGGAQLAAKKGYTVPPLCRAGGAAVASDERAIADGLRRLVKDTAYRLNLMSSFDAYFGVHEVAAPALAECLQGLSRGQINAR